ncbi:MAG: radical SAM protein [Candidatus Methanoplasma sp.]|jgi:DNA repair photolyase|nr:radical SAM protein [Candidatus Methanoplasma sp.]
MNTTDLIEYPQRGEWDGQYTVAVCKRALSPSGLPGIDHALNPYGGCTHGCVYCYAPEVTHSDWKEWRVVKVKSNIASRLSKELFGLHGTIGIGTVTDPYQYAEKRFCLTRDCLDILMKRDMRVHIHTKSDLVMRDAELISRMRGEVGVTVTSVDDKVSKMTEPGAPLPDKRLGTIRGLVDSDIDVYALVGPVLSHLEGSEKDLVDAIASTGVKRMVIDSLNGRPLLSERLARMGIGGSETAVANVKRLASAAGISVSDVF